MFVDISNVLKFPDNGKIKTKPTWLSELLKEQQDREEATGYLKELKLPLPANQNGILKRT